MSLFCYDTIYLIKFVPTRFSFSGSPIASFPKAMLFTRNATFRPSVRMTCSPSASCAASCALLPWMLFQYWLEATGIPEMVNGQWELQHRYVNFTRSGISISLMYVNAADAQQTIVGVINLISNPQYMMLSFEQSYEGTIQQFDGLNFYITENINKPVALWQGDDKLLLFSGRTSQEEVTSLLRTIIREIGE